MPSTLTPKKRLDPEEQEYENNFDFERHERELMDAKKSGEGSGTQAESESRNTRWSRDRRGVAEREAAPSWDTNIGGQQQPSGGGSSMASQMAKKKVKQWVIGGLTTLILGVMVSTAAVVENTIGKVTDMISGWGNKNNNSFVTKRAVKFFKKKFFQADKACTGGVKCRFKEGISQKEVDQMKKQGLSPEVVKEGDKQYLKSLSSTDASGKKVTIDVNNFDEHYNTNTGFRAKLDNIAKPKSMFMRGQQTLSKVFDKFGIKRNITIDGNTDEDRNKSFRKNQYGSTNDTGSISAIDGANDAAAKAAGKVDEGLKTVIEAERVSLSKDDFAHPPSIIPDVTDLDLDPSQSEGVANGALHELSSGSALKSGVQGIFSLISNACMGYQILRTIDFGAKIWKAIGLIKYIGLFMTIFDKVRAGDGSVGTELAFAMGILLKPSTKKDSKGKTFFQSEGFNLMFQGKVADHRGLARWTTGSAFLKFIQGAKKLFENFGANKSTCKQVNSWYGQIGLTIAGLALDIFTGGTFSAAGVATGFAIGMAISVLIAYATPMLIQYAVGTVAPDPTDAEGGYGAGTAMAAGIGAFGNFAGRANGERILTQDDAATVEMESNKEMAFQNQVDNYGKSPFSLDSDTSIPTKMALAALPIVTAPLSSSSFQNLASIITSPLSMFSSSFSNIVTRGVNAQSDIDKGGQFCADEDYRSMSLAVDALCNPIPGEKQSVINDPKYAPDLVLQWMLDKGHIEDDEEGTPKSDDFKKYLRSCVDGTAPISPDGGGLDVGEDVDTRWCKDTDEKFNMFRFFIADSALDTAHKASVDGTLGLDQSGGPAATTPTGTGMTAEQCKTAPNRGAQIACNAALFEPYYYLYGGGHGSIDQIKQYITDAVNGSNKGAAILDCSGLVRTVYYMTLGVDVGSGTAEGQAHSSHFKPINDADAKPGDILWHSSPFDHTAIVVSNDPATKTFTLIEAPRTGKPIQQSTAKYSEFQAFTYTGN